MSNAHWRITFPITKAEERADGLYIVGEATGPEVDGDKERMHPDAIKGFGEQITKAVAAGNPLPYRDAHAKDGVLRDLGEIVGGWLTEKMHLGIEVRLDPDNPASRYLFEQVRKGKKFGMSVAGSVLDYADDYVAELGHVVRTFKSVVLDEISNTTRPAWTPSLGTVLSKSIKDAEEGLEVDKSEEHLVDNDEQAQPAEAVEEAAPEAVETTEKNETEEAATEAVEAVTDDAIDAEHAEKAESPAEPAVEDVEKAGRSISAATANLLMAAHADLQAAVASFGQRLASLGILDPEDAHVSVDEGGPIYVEDSLKPDSEEPAEPTVEKSEEGDGSLETRLAELEKALQEQTALVAELRKAPANGRPPLIAKSQDEVPDPAAALAAMSPHDRLIVGLAARLQGQDLPR